MRTALAIIFLALIPVAHAGSLETLKGELKQDSGKYVLALSDAYTLESGGQSISSKRLQVEGWTVADIPKLDAALGKQIKLTGYIYLGTPSHSEKLVISVNAVPGDSPLYQAVIVTEHQVSATPLPEPIAKTPAPDNNIPATAPAIPATLVVPAINIEKFEQTNIAIKINTEITATQNNILIDNRKYVGGDAPTQAGLVGTWQGKYILEDSSFGGLWFRITMDLKSNGTCHFKWEPKMEFLGIDPTKDDFRPIFPNAPAPMKKPEPIDNDGTWALKENILSFGGSVLNDGDTNVPITNIHQASMTLALPHIFKTGEILKTEFVKVK